MDDRGCPAYASIAAVPFRRYPCAAGSGGYPGKPTTPQGSPVLPGVPRSPLSRGGALRTAGDLPRGSYVAPDVVHYNAGLVHALAEG